MFGLFSKFKSGLRKTAQKITSALAGAFGIAKIDASTLERLEEALYTADFGTHTTEEIIEAIKIAYKQNKDLRGQDAAQIGANVLKNILIGAEGNFEPSRNIKPEIICLVGMNGAGKTTTIAKLAHYFKSLKKTVLIGACDTFRAAANEQINVWAERLKVPIVTSHFGADAAAVAFDTYQSAKSKNCDFALLDTAGRLHTKQNLMQELQKIKRVLQKQDSAAPHHTWLVLDGSVGSNSIEQARAFHKEFGLTGLIITKLDGTSRGGALVGIYRELKLPIYFVGLGEQPDDLKPFSIDDYINALFDS
jgi:fused signal recognition particle receptor